MGGGQSHHGSHCHNSLNARTLDKVVFEVKINDPEIEIDWRVIMTCKLCPQVFMSDNNKHNVMQKWVMSKTASAAITTTDQMLERWTKLYLK